MRYNVPSRWRIGEVVAVLLAWGCAGTELAEEHLYVLRLPSVKEVPQHAPNGPALMVSRFRGEGFARGTTMWARISPIEVEPWIHHKWALPIPELVTTAILEWGDSAGRFKAVGPPGSWREGLELLGVVKAFEEVDEGDKWFALIRLRLDLKQYDGKGTRILWTRTIEEKVPAKARHPQDMVHAFGEALEKILDWAVRYEPPKEE